MRRTGIVILIAVSFAGICLGGCTRHRAAQVIHAPIYSFEDDGLVLADPLIEHTDATALAKLPPAPPAPGFDRQAIRGAGSRDE